MVQPTNFTPYRDAKRQVGSQREVPTVSIGDNIIRVSGYLSFSLHNGIVSTNKLAQKYTSIAAYFQENRETLCIGSSFLDIGCSAGLVCLLAKESGFSRVVGLDHDKEYTDVLQQISNSLSLDIETVTGNWRAAEGSYDVVSALALIHWIYSATASEGSFNNIFEYLSTKARRYLLIEWVDPSDPAIKSKNHLGINSSAQKEEYTLDNFLAAATRVFGSVEAIIDTTPTRRIYVMRRVDIRKGFTSFTTIGPTSVKKSYTRRALRRYPKILDSEVRALRLLQNNIHFPRLLAVDNTFLYMANKGAPLSTSNIPANAEQQGERIVDILEENGIKHNDVHEDNLLVKNGVLSLVDFSWAMFGDEDRDDVHPKIRAIISNPSTGSDRSRMRATIARIRNKSA